MKADMTKSGRRIYDNGGAIARNIPEDVTQCIEEVSDSFGWHSNQCQRKRGHGPEGLYCKQHAKIEEQRCEFEKKYRPPAPL